MPTPNINLFLDVPTPASFSSFRTVACILIEIHSDDRTSNKLDHFIAKNVVFIFKKLLRNEAESKDGKGYSLQRSQNIWLRKTHFRTRFE